MAMSAEEASILATFDPIVAMAVKDNAMLEDVMRDIETTNAKLTQMLANMAENEGIIPRDQNTNDSEVDIDKAEELNKKWKVQFGDLWLIGDHKLLCGDSTNGNDVKRLMQGDKANIVFTDPPYGVAIGAKNRILNALQKAGMNLTDINDDSIKPSELREKLLPVFVNIKNMVMDDDCTVFVIAPQGVCHQHARVIMDDNRLGSRARQNLQITHRGRSRKPPSPWLFPEESQVSICQQGRA